jgi:16S rRNA (cytosine1402-N4)-methyltransferase
MTKQVNDKSQPHLPVLYHEVLNFLAPAAPGKFVDGTIGAGGHAFGILSTFGSSNELLGIDLDPFALQLATNRLLPFGNRATVIHGTYSELDSHLRSVGWEKVQGVLLDLGVSSMQLDMPEKGFSFRKDAPLDMRFNPSAPLTGAELLNGSDEEEISRILWEYGEERNARRIARAIVANRPLHSTLQLVAVVEKVSGPHRGGIHPATRTFQAIRIAVNEELDNLESFLPKAVQALAPGGRLAIISFHSLEDRIVKHYFQRESKDCIESPLPIACTCGHKATMKIVTRHPVEATEEEALVNPRARSAKLRVAERL